MGNNELLSEKEVLKKLAKEEKNKKKNRKARRDAWTAVAIIALILLVGVGLSFYKNSNIEIKEYTGKSQAKQHEQQKNTRTVIMGLGVVCAGVLVIALVNRSKNKNETISIEEQQRQEQKKINEARARVEEARKNRLDEEANVTLKRSNRENIHTSSSDYRGSFGDRGNMSMMDMEDREAYLERRKREYQYYMENDLDEEMEVLEAMEDIESDMEVGRRYMALRNKKWIKFEIAIAFIVIILSIIIVML